MRVDTAFRPLRARHKAETTRALSEVFAGMQDEVAAKHAAGAKRLISAHWNDELSAVVLDRNKATASEVALRVAHALSAKKAPDEYDPSVMGAWLAINATIAGENINANTEADIRSAENRDDVPDPVAHVFGILLASGVLALAQRMVTTAAGFGARDAAQHAKAAAKIWRVNSANPRSAHAAMNGETASFHEPFSNGMWGPGDPDGGPDNNSNCQCSLTVIAG